MTVEANKALVLQYIHLNRNFALLDEILAPNFVDHSHPEFRPGPEDIKQNLIDFYTAFPNASITIENMIGEGDIVAFRFTLQGTHTGTFAGIPPTGKTVIWTGMDFLRIADGKIAELWSNQDTLNMLQQLGVIRFEVEQSTVSKDTLKILTNEIMEMSQVDQKMRKSGRWDSSIDVANTQRIKKIVEQIGWPTRSKVGDSASNMAWLLVQHADHDRAFQKMCLDLMKKQLADDVSPANIAYLEDRVRVAEGHPQLYGTQFYANESGSFGPSPIEDPDQVDERRKAVGLQTLSEYSHALEQFYREDHKS